MFQVNPKTCLLFAYLLESLCNSFQNIHVKVIVIAIIKACVQIVSVNAIQTGTQDKIVQVNFFALLYARLERFQARTQPQRIKNLSNNFYPGLDFFLQIFSALLIMTVMVKEHVFSSPLESRVNVFVMRSGKILQIAVVS